LGAASATIKYRHLQSILKEMGGVVIAFSGGVDSTFLLKTAKDLLGDNVLAVTASSATMPGHELQDAVDIARTLGADHLVIESTEMELPEFVANPPEKCYICKKSRFGEILRIAADRGFAFVLDGENVDDTGDFRPGSRAAKELGVRSPLREAGLSKREIRGLSRKLGLPTWNKAAYACLASRIPYGSPITEEKLKQVDSGEEFIRGLISAKQVRVRHYGHTAKIEIDTRAMARLIRKGKREKLIRFFKQDLGFTFVTLDLEGYETGSLNRVIEPTEKIASE
jgi:pyridinium-3,5-biscarboxylic acid mononucleotide sulfurtransferase